MYDLDMIKCYQWLCSCHQWKTSHTVTLSNWGTCWFAHTCTTLKMWPVTFIMRTTERSAYRKWPGTLEQRGSLLHPGFYLLHLSSLFIFFSKLAEDNHMESPVAILPLPTHDGETEKLIRFKDKEVRSNVFCFQQTFNTDWCVDLFFFFFMG